MFHTQLKKFILVFSALFFLLYDVFALSKADIISPSSGVWANKQPLVISENKNVEIYYSITGTDPAVTGFVYDGPVLIDQTGPVDLRIVAIDEKSNKQEFRISYSVKEELASDKEVSAFISSISATPVLQYTAGDNIELPTTVKYKIGSDIEHTSFLDGQTLKLSEKSSLAEYIPCIVAQGEQQWRFVIQTSGRLMGSFAKRSVPFELSNWTTFRFNGKKLIYAIDDSDWSASTVPVELDRSIPHLIRWQSIAYSPENRVHSFLLPPKPSLVSTREKDGSLTFSLEGEAGYTIGNYSNSSTKTLQIDNGTFSSITADVFPGDSISKTADFAVYFNTVYQGRLSANAEIDRRPPEPPEIVSSAENNFSRKPVKITFSAESGTDVFYSINSSIAERADSNKDVYSVNNKKMSDSYLLLQPYKESAIDYTISAYSVDKYGNKSTENSYKVQIDNFNYYIQSQKTGITEDGSAAHPFTTLSALVPIINSSEKIRIHVNGTIKGDFAPLAITSNFEIIGESNAHIIFPASTQLSITNANVVIKNCVLEKTVAADYANTDDDSAVYFLTFTDSKAEIIDSELISVFSQNGTGIELSSSVFSLRNSGLTVKGNTYASNLNAYDSEILITGSRISSTADTAINFSAQSCKFTLSETFCQVTAHLGRIAELGDTTARLYNNSFTGKLSEKRGINPIWTDSKTTINEDTGTANNGF